MANILIRGPLLTQSGYGVHSRQIFAWALDRGHKIYAECTSWGMTPWYVNAASCDGLIGEIMSRTTPPAMMPDVSIQIQLPNEWDSSLCQKNIGITAGVETNICSRGWVEACQKMDAVIVPSTFTANTFINCGFETPKVISETYYKACAEDPIGLAEIENVKTEKNFLLFGQITGTDSTMDRKNTLDTVKWYMESFKDTDVGLFIKTNSGTNCKMDRRVTKRHLGNYINKIRPKDCKAKVYLLHGAMTETEVASLYKSKKIIGLISATRGEGFGLPLLEAAVAGLPVIATNWSGHKDFLDKGEWLAVDKKLIPVPSAKIDGNIFVPGAQWAQAYSKDFTKKLKALYKNEQYYRKKAQQLSLNIQKDLNFETICCEYDKMLDNL
jgi:glycosyltransferase involved in cell wall biosynthesis